MIERARRALSTQIRVYGVAGIPLFTNKAWDILSAIQGFRGLRSLDLRRSIMRK